MTLRLIREPSSGGATLGAIYVNGVWECWCLEDEIREHPRKPVHDWKIPGKTAIPQGRYQIVITHSPRFKKPLPLLLNVPGFEGVRVHAGNTSSDTEGCLLPGRTRGAAVVGQSRLAFDALFATIRQAIERGEDVWITVENPPEWERRAA